MTASLRESGTERELGRATRAGAVGGERLLGRPAPARWGHQAPRLPRPLAPGHSIFCLVLNARRAWTSLSPSGTSAPLQRRARMLRRPSGTARPMTALRMAPLLPAPRMAPLLPAEPCHPRTKRGRPTGPRGRDRGGPCPACPSASGRRSCVRVGGEGGSPQNAATPCLARRSPWGSQPRGGCAGHLCGTAPCWPL